MSAVLWNLIGVFAKNAIFDEMQKGLNGSTSKAFFSKKQSAALNGILKGIANKCLALFVWVDAVCAKKSFHLPDV